MPEDDKRYEGKKVINITELQDMVKKSLIQKSFGIT